MNDRRNRQTDGIDTRLAVYGAILLSFALITASYRYYTMKQGFSGGIRNAVAAAAIFPEQESVTALNNGNPGADLSIKQTSGQGMITTRAGERDFLQQPVLQPEPALPSIETPVPAVTPLPETSAPVQQQTTSDLSDRPLAFLGDSLLYEAVQAIETYYEYSYIPFYNEIYNRSIHGLHTAGIASAVWDVISRNPWKVFIMGGTNDLWGGISPDQAVWNISWAVDMIRSSLPDCQVIMHGIPPFGRQVYAVNANLASVAEVARYNSLLKSVAAQKGIKFIDLYAIYKDGEGYMESSNTTDGIHIALYQYKKWINDYLNRGIL
ncbi:MAG TPA: hypothetical protein DD727_09080 [Clostridiales bacterium]|nr:hypothetical protein [Clostridiales bacterium]